MNPPRIYPLNLQTPNQLEIEFNRIGVHPGGVDIMRDKFRFQTFKIKNLDNRGASILKQDFLSIGGEVAISGKIQMFELGENDVFLSGTVKQYKKLILKLRIQPFKLKEVGIQLEHYFNEKEKSKLFCGFNSTEFPLIMGILNTTPDSFFDGGRNETIEDSLKSVEKMINQGVHIIDIGGESTRPGAKPVSKKEELNRVIPVIKAIKKKFNVVISVDTVKSEVAKAALIEGAEIVNDISFGEVDANIFKVVEEYKAHYVGMHMKGTPRTMQKNPIYDDVIFEIREYLRKRVEKAIELGVSKDRLAIDPGIGFGKTEFHNLEIIKNISSFSSIGYPVLIGASRKSLIGKLLNLNIENRLSPTIAITCYATLNGVSILRVHDVFETVSAVKMMKLISNPNGMVKN